MRLTSKWFLWFTAIGIYVMVLGGIFYYIKAIVPGDIHDSFHIGTLSEKVNRNNKSGFWGDKFSEGIRV